jgi:hypothetical protein
LNNQQLERHDHVLFAGERGILPSMGLRRHRQIPAQLRVCFRQILMKWKERRS